MSKKVYLYKDIRIQMGLDPGWTYDKDGNLVPYVPPEKDVISDEHTDADRQN